MRLYLAGPMSGLPENNHPEFRAQTEYLRSHGFEVVNPAELDEAVGSHLPWEWYMRRDIELLVGCEGMAVLQGWSKSRGATLEVTIGRALSMPIFSAYTLEALAF